MNIKTKFALSAAALGLMAAPALAADVVYQEPVAPAPIFEAAPVSTWAGPYLGAQLGYGFNGSVGNSAGNIGTEGWMGGAFGGYNFQDGQLVYGIEGDVNYSDIKGDAFGLEARTRVDGSVRGRIGMAVTDDVLIYGTAGVAMENQRIRDTATGASDTNGLVGYTVGAGADVKLTQDVFARAEYRYTDYGSKTFDLPGVGSGSASSDNHRVMIGLGVKF
jgi:outer membrane immunogenic protein